MLCNSCKILLTFAPEDAAFYKKLGIPLPQTCPICRLQRRLSFRNERRLYKRTCDYSKKQIISVYSPDKPYKVYDQTIWLGDKLDAEIYGKPFDFSRSFFEQFQKLLLDVPHPAVGYRFQSENCEYTTYQNNSRNCYLCFGSGFMEDCSYTNWTNYAKNSLGSANIELCYEVIDCKKTYNSNFCQDCTGLCDCSYCYDCHSCKNCFGCVNLRNKQFCFLNKQLTKDKYDKAIREFNTNYFFSELNKIFMQSPRRASFQMNCEKCTGNHLLNCKNVQDSFYTDDSQDCRFQIDVYKNVDCYDCTRSAEAELCCECIGGGDYYFNRFFIAGEACAYCTYCLSCFNSQNLFGCIGLKRKKYCILNKQYSKEDYERLMTQIIEHMSQTKEWGEFFPMNISPFAYEESLANDYFPN
jgi:hypothetical protein